MRGLRAATLGIAAVACLATASAASAHTMRICWREEANGSTTFYAGNYHGPQQPTGGLVIDGATYPFTAVVSRRPVTAAECQPERCDTTALPNAWLVVNVPRVSLRMHQIGVACSNDTVCGWPGCYPMAMNFSPPCADADGDGICDDEDNCVESYNESQADADADGAGDACDVCPADPTDDADFDGVCGLDDNCPDVANPGQEDADGDGIGDVCDLCPLDPLNDQDVDGVCGDVDVCSGTTLPEGVPTVALGVNRFADIDGDGVFNTLSPSRRAPKWVFTIAETAGCSCEQIITELGLGKGLRKYGCPLDTLQTWISSVSP
jgi:hypothetical protein